MLEKHKNVVKYPHCAIVLNIGPSAGGNYLILLE